MASQAGIEPATFPLGGSFATPQHLAFARVYWALRPVASDQTPPYIHFCTHNAPMGTK